MRRIVTLLTDFGESDGYVASVKGVILSLAPEAMVIDAAHHLPAHDVRSAAWVLGQYWRSYPAGTVHLAVVDPGVGTDRKALLLEADGHMFVGPDNGLFSWVAAEATAVKAGGLKPSVGRPEGAAATFHGRDIFAWAAGLLAAGKAGFDDLADRVEDFVRGPWVNARRPDASTIEGEVIHIDHFGNAITNIRVEDCRSMAGRSKMIEIKSYFFHEIHRTYAEVDPGRKLVVVGSSGRLEIAIRDGSAARRMELRAGDGVTVTAIE